MQGSGWECAGRKAAEVRRQLAAGPGWRPLTDDVQHVAGGRVLHGCNLGELRRRGRAVAQGGSDMRMRAPLRIYHPGQRARMPRSSFLALFHAARLTLKKMCGMSSSSPHSST